MTLQQQIDHKREQLDRLSDKLASTVFRDDLKPHELKRHQFNLERWKACRDQLKILWEQQLNERNGHRLDAFRCDLKPKDEYLKLNHGDN